jgi:hypothetical protein
MLPTMATMSDHGYSLFAFEKAGSVERSAEIVDAWGEDGKRAAWWQLAFDTPFLVGYGLFAAAACAAVARRADRAGKPRLLRIATVVVWFGPLAAAADLLQNVSLALILAGHIASPWPQISAIGGTLTTVLMAAALLFAAVGWASTRGKGGGGTGSASDDTGDGRCRWQALRPGGLAKVAYQRGAGLHHGPVDAQGRGAVRQPLRGSDLLLAGARAPSEG